jgi:hypothetical protein
MVRSFAFAALCSVTLASVPDARAGEPAALASTLEPCTKNHYILDQPCALWALDAPIGRPGSVAVGPSGELYFSSPNIVYRFWPEGLVTRVAGNGRPGFSGDGGPAFDAELSFPEAYPELDLAFGEGNYDPLIGPLAVDHAGNLFIADGYNSRVRRIGLDGTIHTVAGASNDYYSPQGVATDPAGNLYIADMPGRLRKIAPDGSVEELLTHHNCESPFSPGLCFPQGIATDPAGNVYVAGNWCRVTRVGSDGSVATVAGKEQPDSRSAIIVCGYNFDGPALSTALAWPVAVALDSAGNVFVADTYNHCIRRVDTAGMVTTVAGLCSYFNLYWSNGTYLGRGYSGDGGRAVDANLNQPSGIALDAAGNLFIADTNNRRIRMVDVNGIITTIAGNGAP